MSGGDRLAKADVIVEWVTAVFTAAGCPSDESHMIGMHLVEADLSGHPSHGIVRVPRYLKALRDGKIRPNAKVSELTRTPALALIDGHFSFGQVLGHRIVELAAEMVSENGVAIIGLRQSGHLGRIGAWAELLADRELISIHFVTVAGSRIVAPFGAKSACVSTAPFAIGVPHSNEAGKPEHFILDFATSRVAEGKVLVALRTGGALPRDALVDADGQDSSTPSTLYGDTTSTPAPIPGAGTGALQTMGDHKGSGLALACELLAGALTGSGTNAEGDASLCNGMLSIVLDSHRFDTNNQVHQDIAKFIRFVRSAVPRAKGKTVMIPGDPERSKRRQMAAKGLPIAANLVDALVKASSELGVAVPEMLSA